MESVSCQAWKLFRIDCGLMKKWAAGPCLTMKFPSFLLILVFVGSLAGAASASNGPANQASAILPQQFAGWQMQGNPQTSTDPGVADPTNAAVLREYRFVDFESATYTRDDGRTLKVRAARFADASGALGAYTFYLNPQMSKMDIRDQGSYLGDRALFFRGQVLIDAHFSKESAMSGGELRELTGTLPRPNGSTGNLPTFIDFMPQRDRVPNTLKYAMGPAALGALQLPVSADLVDFGASSELALRHYATASGDGTLILISYPTPQLAAEHLRRINAAHQLPPPQTGESTIACSRDFCDKRTGPIVAIAAGAISDSDEKSLLGMVNYEANVTWNTPTENAQVRDLYMLILNIVILCAILAGFAIIAGVAFGGFRILMKRLYPDRVFDRPEQMEFISLHLTETVVKGAAQSDPECSPRLPQNPS